MKRAAFALVLLACASFVANAADDAASASAAAAAKRRADYLDLVCREGLPGRIRAESVAPDSVPPCGTGSSGTCAESYVYVRGTGWCDLHVVVPHTFPEAFSQLDKSLPETERARFADSPEWQAVDRAYRLGLGLFIRNYWLRAGSRLNDELQGHGGVEGRGAAAYEAGSATGPIA